MTESFIVRIYRRETGAPPSRHSSALTGVVERTSDGEHLPFHNVDELWEILEAVSPDKTAKFRLESTD